MPPQIRSDAHQPDGLKNHSTPGAPAENMPELQDGEEIIHPSTHQTVGYYLIVEGPLGP